MKITFFFAIISSLCIIANFFATSSCFSLANANKDREINDRRITEDLNVMQNYIQRRKQKIMFSQEYDLGIQPKENNLNSNQQKSKNGNTSLLNVFAGSEVKVSETRGNFNVTTKINNQIPKPDSYNVPDL